MIAWKYDPARGENVPHHCGVPCATGTVQFVGNPELRWFACAILTGGCGFKDEMTAAEYDALRFKGTQAETAMNTAFILDAHKNSGRIDLP